MNMGILLSLLSFIKRLIIAVFLLAVMISLQVARYFFGLIARMSKIFAP